ncbi:MAG: hypothetical protein ACOX3F_10970 [Kiritimatiellia bacterium]|jgi:hypothetical protein
MKSSGSRAMKPSTLSILLMLCACCAWADEVLELQPRLAEAASAQGQAYVELQTSRHCATTIGPRILNSILRRECARA